MKKIFFSFLVFLISCQASTQSPAQMPGKMLDPVHWSFTAKHLDANNFELILTAKIDKGWHIFSQTLPDNAVPLPTTFKFEESKDYTLDGKVVEKSTSHTMKDADGTTDLKMYLDEAVFVQKVKVNGKTAVVKGTINYMKCNERECLPPEDVDFTLRLDVPDGSMVQPTKPANNNPGSNSPASANNAPAQNNTTAPAIPNKSTAPAVVVTQNNSALNKASLWGIFFVGLLAGFGSLVSPCIFSMLPLTVTFFTKRSSTRKKGITNALIYSGSIIFIFVMIGVLMSLFGISGDSINELATNGVFNFLLFALFVVFAISFFGVFEITLPSAWVNKTESLSDKGGLVGIFFMAITLVLISFSCTVPYIGWALVAILQGQVLSPIVGMFAYSLALALPFGFFAFFPHLLHSLPKSGGWLNVIKVTFAFVELALALKFLSNVDLAYHWHALNRDVFLSIWIVIAALTGLYLLGFIRFIHDSDVNHVSVPRLFLAILAFSFMVYLIPGLWGSPLKAISAFPPPLATMDWPKASLPNEPVGTTDTVKKKYSDIFHCPNGLNCYFDYKEGIAAAKKSNKPVFLDFTGWTCINCRKMEASVWSDPQVLKRMLNDYVVISMYVDDKTELPENEKYVSAFTGKKIKTVGNKNSDLEATRYSINSQPYYVLLDDKEQVLTQPRAYNEDVDAYVKFLDDGLGEYRKRSSSQSLTSK